MKAMFGLLSCWGNKFRYYSTHLQREQKRTHIDTGRLLKGAPYPVPWTYPEFVLYPCPWPYPEFWLYPWPWPYQAQSGAWDPLPLSRKKSCLGGNRGGKKKQLGSKINGLFLKNSNVRRVPTLKLPLQKSNILFDVRGTQQKLSRIGGDGRERERVRESGREKNWSKKAMGIDTHVTHVAKKPTESKTPPWSGNLAITRSLAIPGCQAPVGGSRRPVSRVAVCWVGTRKP